MDGSDDNGNAHGAMMENYINLTFILSLLFGR